MSSIQSHLEWNQLARSSLMYLKVQLKSIIAKMSGMLKNSKRQNILFNHLLKLSSTMEVNSPISLGMEPVREFSPNAFGCKMWEV